jgi:hypothetical protein
MVAAMNPGDSLTIDLPIGVHATGYGGCNWSSCIHRTTTVCAFAMLRTMGHMHRVWKHCSTDWYP